MRSLELVVISLIASHGGVNFIRLIHQVSTTPITLAARPGGLLASEILLMTVENSAWRIGQAILAPLWRKEPERISRVLLEVGCGQVCVGSCVECASAGRFNRAKGDLNGLGTDSIDDGRRR